MANCTNSASSWNEKVVLFLYLTPPRKIEIWIDGIVCVCVRACVCVGGWVSGCVCVWVGGCLACAVVDTDVFTYFRKSMQLFLSFLLIS